MTRRLHARLLPLYLAAFFQAFNLWYAIEKMFMRQIGFDDAAIALAVALFTAVTLLVETPSGILADRWSRRGVLIIASLAMIICSTLAGFSDSVPMYLLAISFIGVYYALFSGTYEAVIYDTLIDKTGSGAGFEKYYGRLQIVSSIALISGSSLSGLLSRLFSLEAVYFMTVPFMVISIILLLCFNEPTLHKKQTVVPIRHQIRDTFKSLTTSRHIRLVALSIMLLTLTSSLIFEFNQLWYLALALPVAAFGAAGALVQACLGIGGFLAGILPKRRIIYLVVGALMLTSAGALTTPTPAVVIPALVILQSLVIMLTIIMARSLHESVPSTNRAGVTSAISTATKLLFIPAALLFGFISEKESVFTSSWLVMGLVAILGLVGWKIFARMSSGSQITAQN